MRRPVFTAEQMAQAVHSDYRWLLEQLAPYQPTRREQLSMINSLFGTYQHAHFMPDGSLKVRGKRSAPRYYDTGIDHPRHWLR